MKILRSIGYFFIILYLVIFLRIKPIDNILNPLFAHLPEPVLTVLLIFSIFPIWIVFNAVIKGIKKNFKKDE